MTPLYLDELVTLGTWQSWALFSKDAARPIDFKYRYALGRCWDASLPVLALVCLNPSTADHEEPDHTVRRCLHFARVHGCGSILIRNLFAWRSSSPKVLVPATRRAPTRVTVQDPWGPRNEQVLSIQVPNAIHVAAWGRLQQKSAPLRMRASRSIRIVVSYPNLHVFGWTKTPPYDPLHPLYLPNVTRLQRAAVMGDAENPI